MGAHIKFASHVHLIVLKDFAAAPGTKIEQFVKLYFLGTKL